MKKITLLILLVLTWPLVHGQNQSDKIDFENGSFGGGCGTHNPVEGTVVDNNYFSCAYGVTFDMGSKGSGNLPYISEVATTLTAFVGSQGNSYSSTFGCTAGSSVTADKPSNTRDVGCFFLTDDPNGPGTNPQSLYVTYTAKCNKASGYLLDVDGNSGTSVQEGWQVNGYVSGNPTPVQTIYILSPDFALYNNTLTAFNTNGGDGEPSYWEIDLGSQIIDYIEFRYIGNPNRNVGIAFDDFFLCSAAENAGCCDGENLVPNGSFEAGNTGFQSSYTFQPTIAPNSIIPGQYGVVTPAEAATVSSQWNLVNHTTCDGNGRFLAINGRTMGSGSAVVYEQTGIQVDPEKEYVFCAYYKHLPQCAFDVFAPGNVDIEFEGATAEPSDCEESSAELCGWTKVSFTLLPTGSTIDIRILLDETGIGDGNDFAIDDISLVEKQPMPASYSQFNVSTNLSGGTYSITATAVTNPLPTGFNVTWKVEEVDCNTMQVIPGTTQSWSGPAASTDFPGYCCSGGSGLPGVFVTGKCYKIYRRVTNCCYEDGVSWALISINPRLLQGDPAESADRPYISTDGQNWVPLSESDQAGNRSATDGFRLYPNPGNGHLSLESDRSLKGLQVTVSDIKGKVLSHTTLDKERSRMELDLSELPAGMYLIQMQGPDGIVRQEKYVKQ